MKIDEKNLGKVRKVMKIDEESYKKKLKTIWGKMRKAGKNLGRREGSYDKRGNETSMTF